MRSAVTDGILKYQSGRTLDTCPAYHTALQVRPGSGEPTVFIGLKPSGLDLHFQDGYALHYDLEGRLLKMATPNVHWRRGLSGRVVQLRKRSRQRGGGLAKRLLPADEADTIIEQASQRAASLLAALDRPETTCDLAKPSADVAVADLVPVLSASAGFDPAAARRDVERFRSLYGDIPILPPDQYNALVLLATDGCVYNHCTFCGFYRGVRYRARPADEFREHLERAVAYHGRGLAGRRAIFLGQANALTGPHPWRCQILQAVSQRFELLGHGGQRPDPHWWEGSTCRFESVSSFIDAFTGVHITADQFGELRRLNLGRIFLGVETGDAELLGLLRKPATPAAMLSTVQAAKAGGLAVGVIILIGAGGLRFFESHVEHTTALLNRMELRRGDYIYLSPLTDWPGSQYRQWAEQEGIEPLEPAQMAEQERQIRAGLHLPTGKDRPYVARYDFSHFVY